MWFCANNKSREGQGPTPAVQSPIDPARMRRSVFCTRNNSRELEQSVHSLFLRSLEPIGFLASAAGFEVICGTTCFQDFRMPLPERSSLFFFPPCRLLVHFFQRLQKAPVWTATLRVAPDPRILWGGLQLQRGLLVPGAEATLGGKIGWHPRWPGQTKSFRRLGNKLQARSKMNFYFLCVLAQAKISWFVYGSCARAHVVFFCFSCWLFLLLPSVRELAFN